MVCPSGAPSISSALRKKAIRSMRHRSTAATKAVPTVHVPQLRLQVLPGSVRPSRCALGCMRGEARRRHPARCETAARGHASARGLAPGVRTASLEGGFVGNAGVDGWLRVPTQDRRYWRRQRRPSDQVLRAGTRQETVRSCPARLACRGNRSFRSSWSTSESVACPGGTWGLYDVQYSGRDLPLP
jgi:hypothetical protein